MDFEPIPLAPAVRKSPRKVSVAPWAPPRAGAGRAAASATASGAQWSRAGADAIPSPVLAAPGQLVGERSMALKLHPREPLTALHRSA